MKKRNAVLAGIVIALMGVAAPAANAGVWDVKLDPGEARNVPSDLPSPINVNCYSADKDTKYDEEWHADELRFWWKHNGNKRLRAKYFPRVSPNGHISNNGTVPVYCEVIYAGVSAMGWARAQRLVSRILIGPHR